MSLPHEITPALKGYLLKRRKATMADPQAPDTLQAAHAALRAAQAVVRDTEPDRLLEAVTRLSATLRAVSRDAQLRYLASLNPLDETARDYTRDVARMVDTAVWSYRRLAAYGEYEAAARHSIERALSTVYAALRTAGHASHHEDVLGLQVHGTESGEEVVL